MTETPLARAYRLHQETLAALAEATGPTATDDDLLAVLTLCEGATRTLDRQFVGAVADLDRRGAFTARGYQHLALALADLLGWDRAEAARRVTAAEHVMPRVGLDGTVLPPKLEATAAVFAAGGCSLRHVEVIARALASAAAGRLTPQVWAGAEAALAAQAGTYTPAELAGWARTLIDRLNQDGAAPDHAEPEPVNELFLTRNPHGAGGRIKARFDDAALFDAIVTLLDAQAQPVDSHDHRPLGQRQAEALANACGFVLDHGAAAGIPDTGGRRPHLNIIVRLEDLENRARAACLDFGGQLTPDALRLLACDAAVIPIVMNGYGQPLDIGRATRTIPDGLRRAVLIRDGGCAYPGCDRTPSWTQVHHIRPWEDGGPTSLDNCCALCRVHHRLVHRNSGWDIRITGGLAEFLPPAWIDPQRRPRRKPPLNLT